MKNRVSIEVFLFIMDDIILRRQHECEYSDELHGVFFLCMNLMFLVEKSMEDFRLCFVTTPFEVRHTVR